MKNPIFPSLSTRHVFFAGLFLVVINAAIFIGSNAVPLYWQQTEMSFVNFIWSMNGISTPMEVNYSEEGFEKLTHGQKSEIIDEFSKKVWQAREGNYFVLHSGLRAVDFTKLFFSRDVDGPYCLRYVSYFFDMLYMKFHQYLEIASFRNFLLIVLHILNSFLLFRVLLKLVNNIWASCLGSLLFLNSGVAMATLLFPFRSAKILVVTFYLIEWLIVVGFKGNFFDSSIRRKMWFFLIFILGLFTDHFAFILFPTFFLYFAIKDNVRGVIRLRSLIGLGITMGIFIAASLSVLVQTRPHEIENPFLAAQAYFKNGAVYFFDPAIIFDTGRAFFGYFLPHNFGYWNFFSLSGFLAFMSLAFLLSVCVLSKKNRNVVLAAVFFTIVLLLKNIFPQTTVHPIFMPPETHFPSMLFFSYYYVYCDSLLVCAILSLLGGSVVSSSKKFVFALIPLTFISFANMLQFQNGPQDALVFHGWGSKRQAMAQNILSVKPYLEKRGSTPVYISFPTVDDRIFARTAYFQKENEMNLYSCIIPVMYLHSLESGRAIISLANIHQTDLGEGGGELSKTKYFYDIVTKKYFNLDKIRENNGPNAFNEILIRNDGQDVPVKSVHPHPSRIVFFVKGRSRFTLQMNGNLVSGEQTYGNSYQIYEFLLNNSADRVKLNVSPLIHGQDVSLVGPYIF